MSDAGRDAAYFKWGDPEADTKQTHSWAEVARTFEQNRETIRSAARKYKLAHPGEFAVTEAPQLIEIEGVSADERLPDEDAVYLRAVQDYELVKRIDERKRNQRIVFDRGPIAFVWAADLHFGDSGVDYERAFAEAELIRDTPGMFLGLGGDFVNNFIIGKLQAVRMGARMSIPDEWALVRRYLRIVAPKLLLSVSGNHDNWTALLTGVDYFADVQDRLTSKVIYDADDVLFTVKVGDWSIPCRARHKWRGKSIYNVTHAIERAAKWDQDFLIGFGAHTHTGGYTRDMGVGGADGIAVQAGSYKRLDGFARRLGFAKPNHSTAVAVVINDEHRSLTGFNDLATCADFMQYVYE